MGIYHCRLDVIVAKQLLNSPDILAGFKEVCRKGVTKRVATDFFGQIGFAGSLLYGLLQHCFIEVVSLLHS